MCEINKVFDDFETYITEDGIAIYSVNAKQSIIMEVVFFTIANNSGDVLERFVISDFSRSPRAGFNRIMITSVGSEAPDMAAAHYSTA